VNLARLALLVWCLLSSAYALLCHNPLSWPQMEAGFLPHWGNLFLRGHLAWFLLVAAAAAAFLPRGKRTGFAACGAVGALLLFLHPWAALQSDPRSLAAAFLAWLPLLLWEGLLLVSPEKPVSWEADLPPEEGARVLPALLASALVSCTVFSSVSLLRFGAPDGPAAAALALAWSLQVHAALAVLAFAVWNFVRSLLGWTAAAPRTEAAVCAAGLWLVLALVVERLVLHSMSIHGAPALLYGAVSAAAVAAAVAGWARSQAQRAASPIRSGLDFFTAPLRGLSGRSTAAAALALGLAAALLTAVCAALDWNYLFRTLLAMLTWAGFAGLFFAGATGRPVLRGPAARMRPGTAPTQELREAHGPAVWAAGLLAAAWFAIAVAVLAAPSLALRGQALPRVLDRHADFEPSFRAARQLFSSRRDNASLFAYLKRHTNLPRDTALRPEDMRLSDRPGPGGAHPPHLFLFVVDSLRPDYLGAYAPGAGFTPALDAFAAESVVFRRAFTAYGGTGLAEPSLWSGSLLPHMHFPSPFAPFDNLERLLKMDGYRRWISMGVILKALLEPLPGDRSLDAGAVGDYKFCRTLRELEARLPELGQEPVFVYTQPEDLHISIMNREGRVAYRNDPRFPGRYPPYAERVQAMDACFGRFLAKLKASGRYEDSVVILTADHGDSLGENGFWGHAFALRPEILRIPLIVRLPAALRAGLRWDAEAPSYLIDLVPTLYALLGHGGLRQDRLFGRPLFWKSGDPPPGPRPPQLVASSYGPVYGLLTDGGKRLFVADAVDHSTRCFDVDPPPLGRQIPCAARAEAADGLWLRTVVGELARRFGYER